MDDALSQGLNLLFLRDARNPLQISGRQLCLTIWKLREIGATRTHSEAVMEGDEYGGRHLHDETIDLRSI